MDPSDDNVYRRERYRSLDVLRGCAIISMIQAHVFLLSTTSGLMDILSTLLMPSFFFVMVAGTSFDLLMASRKRRMASAFDIRLEVLLRGGVLLSVDLIMLLFGSIVWPSQYSFGLYWGVFEVIAVGYLLGLILPRSLLSKILSITFLLATILLIETISLNTPLMDSLKDLLPMLLFFQLGRVMHDLYYNNEDRTFSMLRRGGLIVPLVFFFLGYLIAYWCNPDRSNLEWIIESNGLHSIAVIFGNILLLYHIFAVIVDRHGIRARTLHIVERIGRISFSIFFLHIAVIYLVRLLLEALGLDEILPFTSPLWNIVTLISLVLAFYFLERWWALRQYRYGFEWVLRRVPDYAIKLKAKGRHSDNLSSD